MKSAKAVQSLLAVILLVFTHGSLIEQVDDTDLVHLLTGHDNDIIALFTKANCPECVELEAVVENIQTDLKESLGAIIVKAHNSHMISIYDPSREPSLIYFRRGIPLLYYGQPNEDEILQTFSDNREPVVKELSDKNFEHLTQAATGATTGDWFVFFYSADCVLCQRLYAVWEAVGAKLRRRLNVARVNRLDSGISTAKRFGITESPEFIFLRQGKVYRYKIKEYTPKHFIEFVEDGYQKQTHPEVVPADISLMNDLISIQLRILVDNSSFILFGSIALLLVALTFATLKRTFCIRKSHKTDSKVKKAK